SRLGHTSARRQESRSVVVLGPFVAGAAGGSTYIARTPARSSSSTSARDASAAGDATTFGWKRRATVTVRRTSASARIRALADEHEERAARASRREPVDGVAQPFDGIDGVVPQRFSDDRGS